jgi:hypothetical protein
MLLWDKMSQNGKTRTLKNIRAKCHSMGKRKQETDWKYVTDGQNVTIQEKEGGHDVTSDMMSTL